MIPSVDELAGHTGREPRVVHVVPDVPVSVSKMIALSSPDHADAIQIHAYVKFQDLRDAVLGHIEGAVIDEIMYRGK